MAAKKLTPSTGTVLVKGVPKLPVNTPGRARAALARINQAKGLSPGQKRKVISEAYKALGIPKERRRLTVNGSGAIVHKPYNSTQHPRNPKGTPGGKGGKFRKK
jgi:hypothetical protein